MNILQDIGLNNDKNGGICMAKMDNPESWEKIQRNVQEAERLMGQKKYNLSIAKTRQTMEFMVKLQCDKAGIVQGPIETMIRELYDGGWISKTTAEHYLQILSIGNKASKDGDNSAINANQAYHILSQEIYSFADADKPPKTRKSAGNQPNRSRKKREKNGLNSADLLKLLIPAALILILICVIIIFTPKKTPTSETTEALQTTKETTEALQTTEAPTETSSEAVVYKTTTTLNVRKGPSTDSDRIGKLDPGVTVNYTGDYDDSWAIIQYNGQEAYVSKEYLTTE